MALFVVYRSPDSLTPYARNARKHSKRQIKKLAAAIEAVGFTTPILIDGSGQILAGHGRLEAARQAGLSSIPTITLSGLTDAQKRAIRISDNRLAELASWDLEVLSAEIEAILDLDVDFDATLTGFDTGELDGLLQSRRRRPSEDALDQAPAPLLDQPPLSRPGTTWILDRHIVVCGDARDARYYDNLLQGERAEAVFIDPPYNVPISGHARGLGAVQHREFAMATGELSADAYTTLLRTVFGHLVRYSTDGSLHYICMDWRHLHDAQTAAQAVYTELKNLCVWNKTNGGMGSLYRSKHELVLVYKAGTAAHINNVQLGVHGRYRSNVWDYAGVNTFKSGRQRELDMHPTVKPVAMVADALLDCTRPGGLVLDTFAGSGTTLIAAEHTGRRARCLELDPHYVDVCVRRWQQLTGKAALQVTTDASRPPEVIRALPHPSNLHEAASHD